MQAQACASTRSLRSKEGFENARLNLGWNSWAWEGWTVEACHHQSSGPEYKE
jgi:hypothetical protein